MRDQINPARRAAVELGEVDNTPMLDVVFILLIFFVVTASFDFEQGLDIVTPNQHPSEGLEESNIIINISVDGVFSIASKTLSGISLTQYLIRLRSDKPNVNVSIRAKPQAKTRHIIDAIDRVLEAGLATPALSLLQL